MTLRWVTGPPFFQLEHQSTSQRIMTHPPGCGQCPLQPPPVPNGESLASPRKPGHGHSSPLPSPLRNRSPGPDIRSHESPPAGWLAWLGLPPGGRVVALSIAHPPHGGRPRRPDQHGRSGRCTRRPSLRVDPEKRPLAGIRGCGSVFRPQWLGHASLLRRLGPATGPSPRGSSSVGHLSGTMKLAVDRPADRSDKAVPGAAACRRTDRLACGP